MTHLVGKRFRIEVKDKETPIFGAGYRHQPPVIGTPEFPTSDARDMAFQADGQHPCSKGGRVGFRGVVEQASGWMQR